MSRLAWVFVLFAGVISPVVAQVVYPKPPDEYAVILRYRIRATGEQRIVPFEAMAKHLQTIGFKHADEERFKLDLLDPGAEIATGTLSATAVGKLFDDPNIKTAVLHPAGTSPFADGQKSLPLRITLAPRLPKEEQQRLHGQVVDHLGKLGFTPSTAYDHRGYTLVRGSMPASEVPQLVKDLRALPTGWFVGQAERYEQEIPLRSVLPIRTVEVLPDLPATEPVPPPVDGGKLMPELKALVDDPATADKPIVIEAILERETTYEPTAIRRALRAALPGLAIEGLAGSVVTIRLGKASQANQVAELDDVRHIRLPRVATETVVVTDDKSPTDDLADTNLSKLHALGYTGRGVTVAVVASEFPGVAVKPNQADQTAPPDVTLAGTKLPSGSRLIDLTAELQPTLEPAPADPARGPAGTPAALAVHSAAPAAKVLLVRIDPARLHQVLSVAKAVSGETIVSPALLTRGDELSIMTAQLESRRRIVTNEVEAAFEDLSDTPKAVQRRADASDALKQLRADTAAHSLQLQRYLALEGELNRLKGAAVVVNTLTWEIGHPMDGQSELSKLIESKFTVGGRLSAIDASRLPPPPAWVQAGGMSVGSVWSSAYRDVDGNRLMEFGDPRKLPAGRWTRELAFLEYRPRSGDAVAELPAGLKLRVTVQWREPHRPDVILPVEPVHEVRLRLFRQLDPTGTKFATDEMVEVPGSQGEAVRLMKTAGSGAYEVAFTTTLPTDGVYALRLEGGRLDTGLPPSARLFAELYPRIVLDLPDADQAGKGQVAYADDVVQRSGVGIPGDSLSAVTVGIGNESGVTSSTGIGPGVALGTKPELYTEQSIAYGGRTATGTTVAAGYLGGAAACLLQAGVRPSDLVKSIGLKPGDRFVLPEPWLNSLSPVGNR